MTRSIGRIPRTLVSGFILAAFLVPPAQAAALKDPPRVEWGCALATSQVKTGIPAAIAPRGWTVKSSSSGVIVAEIVVRGRHKLVVDIEYDSESFDISYKSSEALNYQLREDGLQIIHRNGNRWMEIARRDILKTMSGMCVASAS